MRIVLVLCLLGTAALAGCGSEPSSCLARPLPDSQLGACLKDSFAALDEAQKEKLRSALAACDPASVDRADAAAVAKQCQAASSAISADATLARSEFDYQFMLLENDFAGTEAEARIIAATSDPPQRAREEDRRAKRVTRLRERHDRLKEAITPP